MKKTVILLLVISTLSGCHHSHSPSPESAQYGTPFDGVPSGADAAIYQLNIRAFSTAGNFEGILPRLDSIKALGVNVIYLMPIYPVGIVKGINSPYCVRDYVGVNKEFGSLNDLRAVVDGAHSRNMAVMLDWVANHTSWDNSWITAQPTWYLQDVHGNILSPPGTPWADVAQLNYSNADMRLEMIKSMKYWVYAANIDGFRCDFSAGPPADFWTQAIDTLRNISTHKLLMLAEGTGSSNYQAGFDYNFGFSFYGTLRNIYSYGQPVTLIDGLNSTDYDGATGQQQIVRYITNHDVNGSDGPPVALFGGKAGSMAAFVVTAYMKGVPMIYSGQEVGTPFALLFPFTSANIDWSLNPDVTSEYKKVMTLRNSSAVIRGGVLTSYSTTDVCAFTKTLAGETVVVISNLRNQNIQFDLPSAVSNATWKDAFSNTSISLGTQLSLPSYSYVVLKNP